MTTPEQVDKRKRLKHEARALATVRRAAAGGSSPLADTLDELGDTIEEMLRESEALKVVETAVNDPKYGHDLEWVRLNIRGALRDAETPVHFAPWGDYFTACGRNVPRRRPAWSITDRRDATTCPDCRSHFTNPTDVELGRPNMHRRTTLGGYGYPGTEPKHADQ